MIHQNQVNFLRYFAGSQKEELQLEENSPRRVGKMLFQEKRAGFRGKEVWLNVPVRRDDCEAVPEPAERFGEFQLGRPAKVAEIELVKP